MGKIHYIPFSILSFFASALLYYLLGESKMINLRSQFLLALSLIFLACGKDPQAPENEQVHIPVKDGRMLLLLINNSNSNVDLFNYSREQIRLSAPDSAWGSNLLEKALEPGKMDTVYSLTEETVNLFSSYRYHLESGYLFGKTLVIEHFDDLMDIFIIVE